MIRLVRTLVLALVPAAVLACGGDKAPSGSAPAASAAAPADPNALTDFQLKHGLGPMTQEVTLGAPDAALAGKGEEVFTGKCSACHKMDEKYVGPALGGVVDRRGPTFVMNMILAPELMWQKHPEVRKLLAEYMTQMPNQQLTQDDARAVVEYLRAQPAPKS